MPKKIDELLEEEINEEVAPEEADIPEEEAAEESPVVSADDDVEELPEEEMVEEDSVANEARRMTADVPVQLVAVLGKKTLSMKELLSLKMGQVLDLARPVNEQVDLIAGSKLFAKGELVDIDGKLGVRIIKMLR